MPVTLNLCETTSLPLDNKGLAKVEDLFVSSALSEARLRRRAPYLYRKPKPQYDDNGDPIEIPEYKESLIKAELNFGAAPVPNSSLEQIHARGNGLVHTLEAAYSRHYHLVLRPDDIWIALLTQFSIYVNKHAEEMRETFVSHEGKKEVIVYASGNLYSADYADIARQMSERLSKSVKDPSLRDWIIPSFSTTTNIDKTVSSIIMMAAFQTYFEYKSMLICGIPRVTLQGEKSDWEALRAKIEKFDEYGEEMKKWTQLLRPVLDSFVDAFRLESDVDVTELKKQRTFWSRVCHYASYGSGSQYLCGWATVFTLWDGQGKFRGDIDRASHPAGWLKGDKALKKWPAIDTSEIASAIAEVPVIVDDGTPHQTTMLAGLPAFKLGKAADFGVAGADGSGEAMAPVVGWAMYEVPPKGETPDDEDDDY